MGDDYKPFREHPVHGILKALTEAEQHTYVRCSLHNHDRDALVEVRHHLQVIRTLADDIIPWHREQAEREARRKGSLSGGSVDEGQRKDTPPGMADTGYEAP